MIKEGLKRTAIMLAVYLLCVGSVLSILIYNFKTFGDERIFGALFQAVGC